MTCKEMIEKRKAELATSLMQFHPELLTAITSDTGSSEIANRINALIEAHCLSLMMGAATGKAKSEGESP
jgi:hypothetical protein